MGHEVEETMLAALALALAVLWYALLWEPRWLLGGPLFLAAARQAARTTSHRKTIA